MNPYSPQMDVRWQYINLVISLENFIYYPRDTNNLIRNMLKEQTDFYEALKK